MRNFILAAIFTLFSQLSMASWLLDSDASSLNFLSTKKGTVTEIHSFKKLSGTVSDEGKAEISIPLAAVETNIPIRNERMKEMLFNVPTFSTATATLFVDPVLLANTQVGKRVIIDVNAMIKLHGLKKELPVKLVISGLQNRTIQVHTLVPILLNAADFSLTAGIEKLRTVAKLSSIDTTIPVTFTLIFQKQ